MAAVTCNECVHFQREYTATERADQKQRCDFEDEAGVATVGTVTDTSDCPWFAKPKINLVTDRYPQRYIKDSGDDQPIIDTLSDLKTDIDPFRDLPQFTRRKRR